MSRLLHTLFGTALVVAGASALNQVFERHSDALMERTAKRPLPSGRLEPGTSLLFGAGLALSGLAYLALTVRQPLAIVAAALALVSYVFLYTPLKRTTTLNTLVGAIPGALPPVIGWAAASGTVPLNAWLLCAIIFFWTPPHFWALSLYTSEDYAKAGIPMMPVARGAKSTRLQILLYSLVFVPVAIAPSFVPGLGGKAYMAVSMLGGTG